MNTLGTTPKTVCRTTETHSINRGFVAKAVFSRGAIVKLDAEGEVVAITAATDTPLGMVVAGNRAAGEEVTVQTQFNALVVCKPTADVVIGAEVSATGLSDEGITSIVTATAGAYSVGVALEAGSADDYVLVGTYRVTKQIPA